MAFATALALHLVLLTAWPGPVLSEAPGGRALPARVQARMLPLDRPPEPPAASAAVARVDAVAPPATLPSPTLRQGASPAPPSRPVVPPVIAAAAAVDEPAAAERPTDSTLAAPPVKADIADALSAEDIPLDGVLAMAPPSAGPSGAPNAVAAEGADAPPVYATRIAPPMRLNFLLRRGMLRGEAVLTWQHGAAGPGAGLYQLGLDARAAGLTLLSQTSQGGFDAAGLAPLRFTDRRLRGSVRATNFQRERGLVSFSGPATQYPLWAGAQDRLSWMLQLPAIVAALPPQRRASTEVELQVFGARGDLANWRFSEHGAEPVATERGTVNAVKWLRSPRKPNDTLVEIWLDPALHYLPIKVRIGNPPDGETLELLRETP